MIGMQSTKYKKILTFKTFRHFTIIWSCVLLINMNIVFCKQSLAQNKSTFFCYNPKSNDIIR